MTVSWAEQMRLDAGLRMFVEARIAQAHVELQALRAEYVKQKDVIVAQERELAMLRKRVKG